MTNAPENVQFRRAFATILRTTREQRGLTQVAFAHRVQIATRQVARYEAGEQQPAFDVAVRMAKALDISLDVLAGQDTDELTGTWQLTWTEPDGTPHTDLLELQARGEHRHATGQLAADLTPLGSTCWAMAYRGPQLQAAIHLRPDHDGYQGTWTGHCTHRTDITTGPARLDPHQP